jgi:hypothetical protein
MSPPTRLTTPPWPQGGNPGHLGHGAQQNTGTGEPNALDPEWAAAGLLIFGGTTLFSMFGLYLQRDSVQT